MGMTLVLSVPAVWMEWVSEKGLDWTECRDGVWRGEFWDWGSRSMVMPDDEKTRTTWFVSDWIGVAGFSVGLGRLRTVSALAGMSGLTS